LEWGYASPKKFCGRGVQGAKGKPEKGGLQNQQQKRKKEKVWVEGNSGFRDTGRLNRIRRGGSKVTERKKKRYSGIKKKRKVVGHSLK